MNKMKNNNYGLTLLVTCVMSFAVNYSVSAQPALGPQCKVFMPSILKKYIVKESELSNLFSIDKKRKAVTYGQVGVSTNQYWYVYSDRSNNTTYDSPSMSGNKYGSLDFNEEVVIAQIQRDFALVYTEPGSPQFPKVSSRAKCKGWVPMSHLLLWNRCPANERGIYNKAIIVGNIDKLKGDNTVGFYYKNPETKDGQQNLHSAMKFYFVMKKDPKTGMHLLAEYSKVGGRVKSALFGWVSEGMYAPWSQRTCLEPNWDKDVVDQLKGFKIPVGPLEYSNPKKKTGAVIKTATQIEMGRKKNNVTNSESLAYRFMPRTLRYPLLGNLTDLGFYKITAFASNGNNEASVDASTDATDKVQKTLDNMRVINLIFVIDGTNGMKRYFNTVQSAINRASSNDYFGRDNRVVKVGVVIYRDRADGKYVTEHLSMRKPTDSKLSEWLKNGGEYGVKNSPDDKSDYEALYEGLKVALDAGKMGYKREQSNLMFVIGDCGNDPVDKNSISQEEIVQKCIENRIQLSSFNVRNVDSGPYQQFRKQMARIVMKNMEGQYAQLGETAKHEYVSLEDGYDFKPGIDKETTYFIGSFRNVKSGKEMDDKQLYSLVYSTSQRLNEAISRQEKIVGNAGEVVNRSGNTAASEIEKKFLKTMLDSATIEALKRSNFLMAFEGFTPKGQNGVDYWQPVIYISQPELVGLLGQLKHVNDEVDKQSDDRNAYVNAMKSLAASMVGDMSEDEIINMKNEDIMNMITGLNVRTDALNYRLVDIQNNRKVTPQQFKELTSRFVDQYKKLDAIRQTTYPFSYRDNNGETWYWIPAEDLP